MSASLTLAGFEVFLPTVVLGTIVGLTYGILGVGLVLIYRTNRIINFAHGEIGAFGAAVFGLIAVQYGVPYYLALPVGLLTAAATGAVTEVAVVRRLRDAPRLMSVIATLGVGQFLLIFRAVVNSNAAAGAVFPQPPGLPELNIGPLLVTRAYSGMLLLAPLVVLALALFLRYTRPGLAMLGAAANRDAARLAGIFASRTSSLAWAIAGGLSGLTAILFSPTIGFVSAEMFGPSLLLRALVAAVIGRMKSLPLALAGGVVVGVVEQTLLWNYPRGGLIEAVLFAIILVALMAQRRIADRREEEGSTWATLQALRPLPEALGKLPVVRHLGVVVTAVSLVALVLLPLVITSSAAVIFTSIMSFAIVGLSVGIITGLGGQLSLGQFALAGIGAVASYEVSSQTGNFLLAFVCAGLVGAVASLVIGLPALRIKGLLLTVTTLSFALATSAWLLEQPWMLGEGIEPGRPIIGSAVLRTGKSYYYFALLVLALVVWLTHNVRRGGIGRQLVAVRDNEDNARAFTIRAALVKTQGFMLAGFVAGIGGAVFSHALSIVNTSTFPPAASINVVVMSVVGGIAILAGPLLGALFVIGVPAFVPLDAAGLAATSFGLLIIILYAPQGIAGFVQPLRDRIVDRLARAQGLDVEAIRSAEARGEEAPRDQAVARAVERASASVDDGETGVAEPDREDGMPLLRVENLHKHFGGVRAVDGVSMEVTAGETVGLIGPNGAGKTTLFEVIGGFLRPDEGRVWFDGHDLGRAGPERRAGLGLIRSFQGADLFPTMTVLDTLTLSLEKGLPTPFFPSLLGTTRRDRERVRRARELVALFGLDGYRNKQVRELSTGTRRILELACLVALEPKLLLLDEPSSGIAQRETETLGALIQRLRSRLDTTLVIIEHDMPLIMGLADRIVAMDTGRIIATGAPSEVRTDPRVVEAYLGGSLTAIQRSGEAVSAAVGNGPADRDEGDVSLSALARIRGVGPKTQHTLLATFGSVDAIRGASVETLREVPGVGSQLAARIHRQLRDGPGSAEQLAVGDLDRSSG